MTYLYWWLASGLIGSVLCFVQFRHRDHQYKWGAKGWWPSPIGILGMFLGVAYGTVTFVLAIVVLLINSVNLDWWTRPIR